MTYIRLDKGSELVNDLQVIPETSSLKLKFGHIASIVSYILAEF